MACWERLRYGRCALTGGASSRYSGSVPRDNRRHAALMAGWDARKLPAGHEPMQSTPRELVDLLRGWHRIQQLPGAGD